MATTYNSFHHTIKEEFGEGWVLYCPRGNDVFYSPVEDGNWICCPHCGMMVQAVNYSITWEAWESA